MLKSSNEIKKVSIPCIICGEDVVREYEGCGIVTIEICDECKKAVMKMRELTHQHKDKGE